MKMTIKDGKLLNMIYDHLTFNENEAVREVKIDGFKMTIVYEDTNCGHSTDYEVDLVEGSAGLDYVMDVKHQLVMDYLDAQDKATLIDILLDQFDYFDFLDVAIEEYNLCND